VAKRRKNPDIEFDARIDAKEMRFGEVPETKVEFFGNPGHESEHGDRRENLPDEVEPNKTYKNVRVDYRLASRLVYGDEEDGEGEKPSG
jgi:hypothetical protein